MVSAVPHKMATKRKSNSTKTTEMLKQPKHRKAVLTATNAPIITEPKSRKVVIPRNQQNEQQKRK
jgi:hypothetical protein